LKKVIITGSSKGIGKAIKEKLKEFEIIELCRSCKNTIDFNDINGVKKLKFDNVYGLINNAGVGYFGRFEDMSITHIQEMINVNFLAPLIITKNHIKQIKKNEGFIINISSTSATQPARGGAVYAATKAALRHFSESLFEEIRKSKVKTATILPDLTLSNFHDFAAFKPSNEPLSHLKPSDIASIIEYIINTPKNVVIQEVKIKPQFFKIEKSKAT